MTAPEKNSAVVQEIYAAFGRQDIAAIVERLHPEVEWEFGAMDHGVPWLKPGRGIAHAISFFQSLAALEFKHFSVTAVMASGPWVVGLVQLECVNPATGRTLRENPEAHVWKFDEQGRIIGMRHCADTHQHWLAAGNG